MTAYLPPIRAINVGYTPREDRPPFSGFRYTIPKEFTATGKPQTKQESFGAIFGKGTLARTKTEAEKMIQQWHAAREVQSTTLDVPTVEELGKLFIADDAELRDGNTTAYYVIKRLVKWFKGSTLATEMTLTGLASMSRQRQQRGDSSTTVRQDLTYAMSLLHFAQRKGLLPPEFEVATAKELAKRSAMPEAEARDGHLDAEQEAEVWELCSQIVLSVGTTCRLSYKTGAGRVGVGRYRAALFICIALETASRATAIDKLRWEQIDLAKRALDFNPPGRVKTKKKRVPQQISDRLYPVLKHAHAIRTTELVLIKSSTTVYSAIGFLRDNGYDITRHDLRRTWAILNLLAGMPVADVAGWLGDSIATVEKHYAHWLPGATHLSRVANFRQQHIAKVLPFKRPDDTTATTPN